MKILTMPTSNFRVAAIVTTPTKRAKTSAWHVMLSEGKHPNGRMPRTLSRRRIPNILGGALIGFYIFGKHFARIIGFANVFGMFFNVPFKVDLPVGEGIREVNVQHIKKVANA